MILSGEMRAVDLARELGIKDSALRRWAQEHGEMGENAFPGNGSPKVNKDHGIAKLRKRIEELERENELLNNFRAFLSQDHARGARSSKSIRASSAPSGKHAGSCACPNSNTTTTQREGNPTRRSSGRPWRASSPRGSIFTRAATGTAGSTASSGATASSSCAS